MLRLLGEKIIRSIIGFFASSNIVYDPDPEEVGYTRVNDSAIILFAGRISILSFVLCMLIPIISIYQPFGYTIPFDSTVLFLFGIGLFFVMSKTSNKVRCSTRVCPECGCEMTYYPNVERSTFKYTCHDCKVYIDTYIPNYSDP